MNPEEQAKIAKLREAIAALDDLEAPFLANIAEIEAAMRRLDEKRAVQHRLLDHVGDRWADQLDKDLPGWRALLGTPLPPAEPCYRVLSAGMRLPIGFAVGEAGKAQALRLCGPRVTFEPITAEEYANFLATHSPVETWPK